VVVPVGSYVNEINVVTLAEFLVTLLTRIDVCRLKTSLTEIILTLFCALCLIVAKSNNFYTRDVAETHYRPRTTHTQTNEGHTHGLQLWSCQTQNMLLTCRALGTLHYNGTLIPMPLGAGRKGLSTCRNRNGGKSNDKKILQFHSLFVLFKVRLI
jgi:hypothetical protein